MSSLRHMFAYLFILYYMFTCMSFLSESVPWLFGPEASLE